MRIVIDMQGIQAANRNRGLGRYSFQLVQEIVRNRGNHEVFLVLNGLLSESIETIRTSFHDLLPQENIRVWDPTPIGSSLRNGYLWRRRTQELVREAFLSSLSPDIVLIGSLFEGETDDAIVSIGELNLTTLTATIIHDLVPLTHRQKCLRDAATEDWYENKLDQLRRSDMLLTISEAARVDCIQQFGFGPDRVINVGPAIDPRFCPNPNVGDQEKQIRQRYGIVKPFVLCLGVKGACEVIQAYAALPKDVRNLHQLVIAAHTPLGERKRLKNTARECGLRPSEYVITYDVLENDLPVILEQCRVFAAPAWEDGFGLASLEAMACGKAVIGADFPTLREVVGREDALFEPWSVAEISEKLLQVLSENDFRSGLERHGLECVAKFSFNSSAMTVLSALESCYAKRSARQSDKNIHPASRPKMAFVSPLSPERTGIADYSAELLPELARHYDIDVIVEQEEVSDVWVRANCQIHDSAWLISHADNYDRVLYHIGNSISHKHMFELMGKVPGMLVLHDFYLAHVIFNMDFSGLSPGMLARELYRSHGYFALQERFQAANPADVVWPYPCNLAVLQKSIGVIVHSESSMRMARKWYGNSASDSWSLIPHLRVPIFDVDRAKARQILNLEEEDFVVCSFGVMGASKLNHILIDAWLSSKLASDKNAVLIFVGDPDKEEYGQEISRTISECTISDRIRITGWVDMVAFRHYLAVADVAVQLRTLSRGETAGTVLDCMNYGLPTIVNANGSLADLPEEAVWKLQDKFSDDSLVDALEKLWKQPNLRKEWGGKAREIILTRHSPRACADKYAQAIESTYLKAHNGPLSLAHALAKIEPYPKHNQEYSSLAQSVVSTLPARPAIRQLLVDISAIVFEDLKTGIQRVTRSILRELLLNPPDGFRVEPVYDLNGGCYRYARKYSIGLLGNPDVGLTDELAQFNPDDIFFILDLNHTEVSANQYLFNRLRNREVQILFLVYDILPIMMPQFFPPGMAKKHHQWLQVVAESDGAICISKNVADHFHEWLTLHGPQRQRPFKIGWSHLAADINASTPSKGLPTDAGRVLTTLMGHPTFLIVGTVEPRKGYAQTISAFEKLWGHGQEINLVIVGKAGWNVDEIVDKLAVHPLLNRRLFWLKGVSDEYLTKVYAASDCLIAASEGEGFGLPLIEAAKHGLPIIARDIPVFREVAGDHATYFNGTKPESLEAVILHWLDLFRTRSVPNTNDMPYLTWSESARTLVGLLLDDEHPQWSHRWMPAEESLQKISTIHAGEILRFDSEAIRWIGWAEPEKKYVWNFGKRSAIRFNLAPDTDWQGKLTLKVSTLGTQRIGVRFNGTDLGEETLEMNEQKWIIFTEKAPLNIFGENELTLEFHDARQASENDPRLLALRITELTFL